MKRSVLALLLCSVAVSVPAQTAYRWVDGEGRLHFSADPPPPGAAKKVETLKPGATAADAPQLPYAVRQAAADFPVTLFAGAGCGNPCDQGRSLLKKRGLPFAEKDATTPEGRAALNAAARDTAVMPVLVVGKQVAKGFLAAEWNRLLDAAGYPTP